MLIIADGKKPVAIAGIMGGENSFIKQDSADILLESAYFDPGVIRRTSKKARALEPRRLTGSKGPRTGASRSAPLKGRQKS